MKLEFLALTTAHGNWGVATRQGCRPCALFEGFLRYISVIFTFYPHYIPPDHIHISVSHYISKGSHVSYGGRCPCTSSDGSGRSKGRRASRGRGDAAGETWLEFPVDFGGEFEGKSKNCPIHFLGFKKLLRTTIYINLQGKNLICWYIEVMQ